MTDVAITADHDAPSRLDRQAQGQILECMACDRSHSRGDGGSARCRAWLEAGEPPYKPTVVKYTTLKGAPMPMTAAGFAIRCTGCRQIFSSRGLRCCSPICEQNLRHQEDRRATLAELGIEPAVKRKCAECGHNIPRWTGSGKARRAVRKDARFCSDCCRQKQAQNPVLAPSSQNPVLTAIEAQKPLQNGGSQ